ncbi:MAG: flavodoxin [Dysgonomonas sp.]
MEKIGLFYGTNAVKTAKIAEKIQKHFGDFKVEIVSVDEVTQSDFQAYNNLIFGASTWFDGELPAYWEEALPELTDLKMDGKKVAIFGLGNQVDFSENFVDGIGILAEIVETAGAEIVGLTNSDGYSFEKSKALRNGKFLGLAIDQENQSQKTDERIRNWVEQLKTEFI